jgi:hypothetical protein
MPRSCPGDPGIRAPAGELSIERDEGVEDRAPGAGQLREPASEPRCEVLEDHRDERHVGDPVTRERVPDELRSQRSKMDHRGTTQVRSDESHHEVDGVIRGKDAEVAESGTERMQLGERAKLLQVVAVREQAAFGAAAGAGAVHDARDVVAGAGDDGRRVVGAGRVLPPHDRRAARGGQLAVRRGLRHEDELGGEIVEAVCAAHRLPQVVLDEQDLRGAVREESKVLGALELEVERNENATGAEDRERRQMPLRLVRHHDRGAVGGLEAAAAEESVEAPSPDGELPVRQSQVLAIAVRFDEAGLVRPMSERGVQRLPEGGHAIEVDHPRRA